MEVVVETKITDFDNKTIKIEFEIELDNSFAQTEENILTALNEAGTVATEFAIKKHDTDGSPIILKGEQLTSKGRVSKKYQSPYGAIQVLRHVYQSNKGGKTYCPLDDDCRIIVGSTPKFAKMVSSKYSEFGGKRVQSDLLNNHARYVSHNYVQDVSNAVSSILISKEQRWTYSLPEDPKNVAFIGVGLDGTCIYISEDGYRETMVGTATFYDIDGNRLSTIYNAAAPEYGKAEFYSRFENELHKIKKSYSEAKIIGVADGAKDNWTFLEKFTKIHVLDFYHVSEYVSDASYAIYRKDSKRRTWFEDSLHKLKHEDGARFELLKELKTHATKKLGNNRLAKLNKAITYFENHLSMMCYSEFRKQKYPIGSGVTEAACKTIVKQRLSSSGMKWKKYGAETVLCLRSLNYSSNRWNQAWKKIGQYGT
jgi:hypothetical protein